MYLCSDKNDIFHKLFQFWYLKFFDACLDLRLAINTNEDQTF